MTGSQLGWSAAALVAACAGFLATRAVVERAPSGTSRPAAPHVGPGSAGAGEPLADELPEMPRSIVVRRVERSPSRLEQARLDQPLETLTTEQVAQELVGEAIEIASQACNVDSPQRIFATARVDATPARLTVSSIDIRGGVGTDPAVLDCLRRELVGTWTADADRDDGEAFAELRVEVGVDVSLVVPAASSD
jgi:hypothetical protein